MTKTKMTLANLATEPEEKRTLTAGAAHCIINVV